MNDRIKPLKKFGQNYLKDKNILKNIAAEINPQPGENIIEIGPGLGALTSELLERVPFIKAVEIDKRVGEELNAKFGEKLQLIEDDFMKLDFAPLGEELRVVGNIPYNITSPILFKLFEHSQQVKDSVLLVQLEVAQRITAKRGSRDYSILSVLCSFFADTRLCFKVSPNVFYPKPKVFSAIIHLQFKKNDFSDIEKKTFIQTVKAGFGNRRKTLKNSLSNSIFKDIDFSESGVDLTLRAEQLEVEDFLKLSRYILDKKHL